MPWSFRRLLVAPRAGAVAALLLSASAPAQSPTEAAPPSPDVMSVRGTQVLRNGRPFQIKGVQIVGFVATPDILRRRPWYWNAYRHFGPDELRIARSSWHANTILFKLGEPELDPQSGLYSDAYVQEVVRAVALARGMGFPVIVSIDELPPSGTPSQSPLPTRSTLEAVRTLARLFGSDRGVMLEPYNEPFSPSCAAAILSTVCSGTTADAWALWRDGSPDGTYVGMNALIAAARAAGAGNLVLIQPLGHGGNFQGFPGVSDPLHRMLYAVHPYFIFAGLTPASWDAHFGNFAASHPVIADEWTATSRARMCSDPPRDQALRFLRYIAARNIGLVVWAIDLPGTIVRDYQGTPNTLSGYRCGDPGGGAGDLIEQFFAGTLAHR